MNPFDAWRSWQAMASLALEAQQVVWLRTLKLMSDSPAARREGVRMIAEKGIAAQTAVVMLATGAAPEAVAKYYRRKVAANRRRLLR